MKIETFGMIIIFSIMLASTLMMAVTFFGIARYGSWTWSEPNNLILYLEFMLTILCSILGTIYAIKIIIREDMKNLKWEQ